MFECVNEFEEMWRVAAMTREHFNNTARGLLNPHGNKNNGVGNDVGYEEEEEDEDY